MTEHVQLWSWLKDSGITQEQAARQTGYTLSYVNAALNGYLPLTDAFKMRFIKSYPETARFLLPQAVREEIANNAPR